MWPVTRLSRSTSYASLSLSPIFWQKHACNGCPQTLSSCRLHTYGSVSRDRLLLQLTTRWTVPPPRLARHNKKPRYIFVDLGANSADSLEVVVTHEDAKFEYDFLCPDWAHRARLVSIIDNLPLARVRTSESHYLDRDLPI